MDIKDYAQMMRYLTRPRDVIPEPRPMAQGGRIPFDNGGDTSPVKTEEYKYPRSNRFGTVYSKTPGTNQYGALTRSLEEVQAIIDNAPKIQKKNKVVEMTKKDLEGRSEYNNVQKKIGPGKIFVTRKELDKFGDKLKFKTTGKAVLEEPSKGGLTRRAKIKPAQGSEITIKGGNIIGKNFSHVYPIIEDAPPGTKTTTVIDADMNAKLIGYNRKGQTIAERQQDLIRTKPSGYQDEIMRLNGLAKKNVMNAIQDLGKDYKGQIGYFQVDPETGSFKPKAGNYKMSFAGIEGKDKIYRDMTPKERQAFSKKISLEEFAKADLNKLAAIGCPGKAMGGRIGFFEGQNLNACATKGVEKLKGDPGKLTSGDQANLRAISKSTKAARLLKNVLGPAAILGEVLVEGGIAANKFMSEGVPIKQALGESYINKYLLGPKTQIDVEAERAKEFAKGEDFAMAERGRRMAPFMAQSKEADAQRLKKRKQQMEQVFPTISPQQIDEVLKARDMTIQDFGMTYPQVQDFIKQDQQMQAIADAGGVANLAEGGIASLNVKK
jgi:hypothetical protein